MLVAENKKTQRQNHVELMEHFFGHSISSWAKNAIQTISKQTDKQTSNLQKTKYKKKQFIDRQTDRQASKICKLDQTYEKK